jgi:hypothetical protein
MRPAAREKTMPGELFDLRVMDAVTPLKLWPPEWDDLVDYKREFALANPRAAGVEVRTTAGTSALVVTRIK